MSRVSRHLACAGGFALALIVLLLCAYYVAPVTRADATALAGLRSLSIDHRSIDVVGTGLTHSVDLPLMVLILASIAATGFSWGRRRQAIAAVILVAGASVLTLLIKVAAAHPRNQAILAPDHLSAQAFPSGHTTAAMSLALAAVIVAPGRWRPLTALLAGGFALAVSIALIVEGWHYPSDVLGGFSVVGLVSMLVLAGLAATEGESRRRGLGARRARLRAAAVLALQAGLLALAIAGGVLFALHPSALASYVAAQTTAVAAALAIGAAALGIVSSITAELEAGQG